MSVRAVLLVSWGSPAFSWGSPILVSSCGGRSTAASLSHLGRIYSRQRNDGGWRAVSVQTVLSLLCAGLERTPLLRYRLSERVTHATDLLHSR